MIKTEAWTLHAGPEDMDPREPIHADLILEDIEIPEPGDDDVLVAPLYGCWEANMTHAIERAPVDVARQRGEEKIVLGNAAVVRVLDTGKNVKSVASGDFAFLVPLVTDQFGYPQLIHGYDAPGSVGMLSKKVVLPKERVEPLPKDTAYTLPQWATYARYWTAWSNWKVAYHCWRSQMDDRDLRVPYVWGWGGGVSIAQMVLARNQVGAKCAMVASTDDRLKLIEDNGIEPIDRRQFPDLYMDTHRYKNDRAYAARYVESEKQFMAFVRDHTDGHGVSVFIDNIGAPVHRATLRALGRQGVICTAGWKEGMQLMHYRAIECIKRHIHVHTHAIRRQDVTPCVAYQEEMGWLPVIDAPVTKFEDIPKLAQDYEDGKVESYFPIYAINEE